MPQHPEPISSNIAEDFQAPPEATRPLQEQMQRIRNCFAAADGKWLGVLNMLQAVEFSPQELTKLEDMRSALRNLNLAILNRRADDFPDQPPAKNAQTTY